MNTYRSSFHARCPANGARIHYHWTLTTDARPRVEAINDALENIKRGFHEEIADDLHRAFGGLQTLVAEHHGVTIETRRDSSDDQFLPPGHPAEGY